MMLGIIEHLGEQAVMISGEVLQVLKYYKISQ